MILGDLDGDGKDEMALGNPYEQDIPGSNGQKAYYGQVTIFSGASENVIWSRASQSRGDALGVHIQEVGDVDGDGFSDVAIGDPGSRLEEEQPGKLYLVSGQDGSTIYRVSLGIPGDGFGRNLSSLADLDGDGVRELAVSAGGFPLAGYPRAGRVDVRSGATGAILWTVLGQDFDRFFVGQLMRGDILGAELANAGDTDGDGFDDLLIYAGRGGVLGQDWGRIYLRSGLDGHLLASIESERNDTAFGGRILGIGDVDGDGRSEFAIGAPTWDLRPEGGGNPLFSVGRVYVMSYAPSGIPFIRGDADLDGAVGMADAIFILRHLFRDGPSHCEEAMDIDRSHEVRLFDAVIILGYLFHLGAAPQPPFPDCGGFLSFAEQLSCERSACSN